MNKRLSLTISPAVRPWLFLFLPLLFYIVMIAYPIIYSIVMSFFSWDGFSDHIKFIGIQNYTSLVKNGQLITALKNNLLWMAFFVPLPMFLGFILAYGLRKTTLFSVITRTFFYLPMILSFTVMALIWGWVYDPDKGLIVEVLSFFKVTPPSQSLLTNNSTSIFAIIAVGIWHWVGFPLVLYISAIKDIPSELFEAAEIDGAGSIRQIFYIIIPLVKHASQICIAMGIVLSVKIFDLVFLMSGGYHENNVLSTLVWNLFSQFKIGSASAVSVVQFLFVIVIVVPYQLKVNKSEKVEF